MYLMEVLTHPFKIKAWGKCQYFNRNYQQLNLPGAELIILVSSIYIYFLIAQTKEVEIFNPNLESSTICAKASLSLISCNCFVQALDLLLFLRYDIRVCLFSKPGLISQDSPSTSAQIIYSP